LKKYNASDQLVRKKTGCGKKPASSRMGFRSQTKEKGLKTRASPKNFPNTAGKNLKNARRNGLPVKILKAAQGQLKGVKPLGKRT